VAGLADIDPKEPKKTHNLPHSSHAHAIVPMCGPPRRPEGSMDTEARLLREIGEGSQGNMENITLGQQFSTIDELSTR